MTERDKYEKEMQKFMAKYPDFVVRYGDQCALQKGPRMVKE